MEHVEVTPVMNVLWTPEEDLLFEVSPNAESETIVEVDVEEPKEPKTSKILVPSDDLKENPSGKLPVAEKKAVVAELPEGPTPVVPADIEKLLEKLTTPDKKVVYKYTSTDGTNRVVVVFTPIEETDYTDVITEKTPLFDVKPYETLEVIEEEIKGPAIILGPPGTTVSVKKCAASSTPTPTTFTPTTPTMTPTTPVTPTTTTPFESSTGPTICYDGMEDVVIPPTNSINKIMTTDQLFEVSHSPVGETVVDVVIDEDKEAIVLTPTKVTDVTTLKPGQVFATVMDIGDRTKLKSPELIKLLKLNKSDKLKVWIFPGSDDVTRVVTVFPVREEPDFTDLFDEKYELYDVKTYETVEDVEDYDKPVFVVAKQGTEVTVRKCAEATTVTAVPTTYTPTTRPTITETTVTPVTSGTEPTICYAGMELLNIVPTSAFSKAMTTDQIFEVSHAPNQETVVDIKVDEDKEAKILTPSDVDVEDMKPEEVYATVIDIGERTRLRPEEVLKITKLNAGKFLKIWIVPGADGKNRVVTVFPVKPTGYTKDVFDEEHPLYDIKTFEGIDQVEEAMNDDKPVYVIAKEGTEVIVKKCAEQTTVTELPTTHMPTTKMTTPTTSVTAVTAPTICYYGMEQVVIQPAKPITKVSTNHIYEVSPNPQGETVVEITVENNGDEKPKVLVPSTDDITALEPKKIYATVQNIGKRTRLNREESQNVLRIGNLNTMELFFVPSNDDEGTTNVVVMFPVDENKDYTGIFDEDHPLYNVEEYDSVEQVEDQVKPVFIYAKDGTDVTVKKCATATTATYQPTTITSTTYKPTTVTPPTVTTTTPTTPTTPTTEMSTEMTTLMEYTTTYNSAPGTTYMTEPTVTPTTAYTTVTYTRPTYTMTTYTPTTTSTETATEATVIVCPSYEPSMETTQYVPTTPSTEMTTPSAMCKLDYQTVMDQLKYAPIDQILGTSEYDSLEVYYNSMNMSDGDVLEKGVKVFGHCYVCECIDHPTIEGDYKLECTIDPYCKCPNYTARCEDDCYNATLIVEFDSAGVDPACYPNDTCEPQDCTTTTPCITTWAEWTECDGCTRTRTRYCDTEVCGEICVNGTTSNDTELCGPCASTVPPTTPYCDEDSEEWGCYNHYIMCNQSCRTLMNREVCASLNRTDPDMPCNYSCICKDGYSMDSSGKCVKDEDCECYNGTIPLPFGYKEYINECEYCECKMGVGYVCNMTDNCNKTCPVGEWEEWSPCSASCDNGTRIRTRTVGDGAECTNTTTYHEEQCQLEPCPTPCQKEIHGEPKELRFEDPEKYGICVSKPLDVYKCVGSCGFSKSGGKHYPYHDPNSKYPLFDLDYFTDCECCQATMEPVAVEFTCEGSKINTPTVQINVTTISACNCMQCR